MLEALGVDNFGIANVVGGVVTMFTVISGSLSGSVSRFLTFALGEGDKDKLQRVFSISVNIMLALAILVFLLGEIGGIWFVNNKLNIPPGRLEAAHWVLQCSLLAFCTGLISTPYNACIIAHEKMNVFAYMTILDVAIKLLFAYMIFITPFDKLITYTVLNLAIALLMRVIYGVYCSRKFEECHYKFATFDRGLVKDMTSFAWWGFFGNTAWMFNTQGVNILINMFFGVAFNAARGVASQVETAVMGFVGNFVTALNPQITKSYAAGDKEYLFSLICRGARYTFYLTLFFMIPVCLEANTLLEIWLTEVPPYAALFLRLSVACTIATQYGNTSYTAIMATGKIGRYQIAVTVIGCLVFPLTWLAYKLGFPVESTYYVFFPIYIILILVRLVFLKILMEFPIRMFFMDAVLHSVIVLALSVIPPLLVVYNMDASFLRLVLTTLVSIPSLLLSIWFWGITKSERTLLKKEIKKRMMAIGIPCVNI